MAFDHREDDATKGSFHQLQSVLICQPNCEGDDVQSPELCHCCGGLPGTYESGKPVPHTQTQLYTELTLCFLSRYLSSTGDPLASKLPDYLEDLPHDSDLYQQLVKVGKLAFNGKQREQVIFKQLPEGCSDLGLLVKNTETTTYNFIHLTLQEYECFLHFPASS